MSSNKSISNHTPTGDTIIVSLAVSGMSCAACVNRISTALNAVDGVKAARIRLADGKALVSFDPVKIDAAVLISAVQDQGYRVTRVQSGASFFNENNIKPYSIFTAPGPYIKGILAFLGIIGFYLGLLTLTSDWYFAGVQFGEFRVWIISLAAGLGFQVFLYSNLRLFMKHRAASGATKSVVVSGSMSAAGMAACCAHYLVTVIPVLGVPFVTTAVAALETYQVWFFALGVLSNAAGIVYMLYLMYKNGMVFDSIGHAAVQG